MWLWLLRIFLLLLPFSFALNPSPTVDLSIVRVLAPIIFVFWLFDSLRKKQILIDKRPRFWFFFSFLFISGLSFYWSIDEGRALRKILFLLPFFSLYFPVYTATHNSATRTSLIKLLFWSTLAVTLLGLIQFSLQFFLGLDGTLQLLAKTLVPFFQGENFAKLILQYPSWLVNINGQTMLRAFGSFPDPHLFSLFLNITLPLAFWLYWKEKKYFYLIGGLVILSVSLLTFSRAAYLSLAAGSIFWLIFSSFRKLITKKPLLVAGAIIILLVIFLSSNPVSNRFYASFNLKEGSNSGRIFMWEKAWEITLDYPLTGLGLGNFSRYVEPQSPVRNPIYAHNLLLDFASETGLIATLLLLAALLCPIFYFFRRRTFLSKTLAASFVILLIHSQFETPFYSVNVFPLIITLLAINLSSHAHHTTTADN